VHSAAGDDELADSFRNGFRDRSHGELSRSSDQIGERNPGSQQAADELKQRLIEALRQKGRKP